MPFYSFNMKKGKYQVEMVSDDIYFAKRQVEKLFDSLIKVKGKMRVVLPDLPPEKPEPKKEEKPAAEKTKVETKESKPQEVKPEKETKKEEVPTVEPKKEEKSAVKEVPVEPAKKEPVIEEKPEEEPQEPETPVASEEEETEEAEPEIEEEAENFNYSSQFEHDEPETPPIEDSLEEETEPKAEEKQEEAVEAPVIEEVEEVTAEEEIEETEPEVEIEEIEEETEVPVITEEQPKPETPAKKKPFSFKSIADKIKGSDSKENSSQQKIEFQVPEELEEKAKNITQILEEKIKKNLPIPDKTPAPPEEEIYETEEEEIETEFENMIPETVGEDISDIIKNHGFESLEELISLKRPESKLDYLLITAYYLQAKENIFKYSLKQLNSKIVPFLGDLVDHSVIHEAVANDFIEVVPDYNGSSDVTEYRLTEQGENYLLS